MTSLKIGHRGQEVFKLQLFLNSYLNPCIKLKNDGHFGKKTEDAVKVFQKKKGLTPDEIVGNKTRGKLANHAIKPTSQTISFATTTPSAPWYDIAVAEIGVKELLGPNKNNKRIIEYHGTTTLGAKTDEVPWCSSFVNWVMIQSGIKGTNNALAKSWATCGQEIKTPTKGDIVVIKRINKSSDKATGSSTGYHVGFYVTSNNTVISILGGNQSNQVKKSNFLLKSYDIIAYCRPTIGIIGIPLNASQRSLVFV